MWAVVVVELLPFGQLLVEIDIAGVRQQLVELLLVGPMRPLHLAVELRRPGLDVDVADALIGEVPMKLGLELMAAVGPHRMNPKRELCDHVVEKTYGVRLGVARVNLEGPDAGGIVDGGVLIATYRPATWADELQERDIDLDVMAGDLLGVAMRVHRSTTDPAG